MPFTSHGRIGGSDRRVALEKQRDPGPAVSVALAGSAGFQVSAPERPSADRFIVGFDFPDLRFNFSFAGLSVVAIL